jgi:hypothetical protein
VSTVHNAISADTSQLACVITRGLLRLIKLTLVSDEGALICTRASGATTLSLDATSEVFLVSHVYVTGSNVLVNRTGNVANGALLFASRVGGEVTVAGSFDTPCTTLLRSVGCNRPRSVAGTCRPHGGATPRATSTAVRAATAFTVS